MKCNTPPRPYEWLPRDECKKIPLRPSSVKGAVCYFNKVTGEMVLDVGNGTTHQFFIRDTATLEKCKDIKNGDVVQYNL